MVTTTPRTKDKNGYLILPETFYEKGFNFKQLFRKGNLALYKKVRDGNPRVRSFELIVIQKHDAYMLGQTKIEAAETYPSSSTWGQFGWTFTTKDVAELRFNKLLNTTVIFQTQEKN